MVELKYVQRRKRKKIIAIATAASAMGLAVLAVVSFLGRFVGQFTVALDTGSVQLALSEDKAFTKETSYLRINDLPKFSQTNYAGIRSDAGFTKRPETVKVNPDDTLDSLADSVLDSTTYGYLMGGEPDMIKPETLDYFKYTFYVKNVGTVTADYQFSVNVLNSSSADDDADKFLLDSLRVRVFENSEDDSHESRLFARQTDVYSDAPTTGIASIVKEEPSPDLTIETYTITYSDQSTAQFTVKYDSKGRSSIEGISSKDGFKPDVIVGDNGHWIVDGKDSGINAAGVHEEAFESNKKVVTTTTTEFKQNDIKRYTLVAWLDGDDPASVGMPPKGSTVQLGVNISAYEHQE